MDQHADGGARALTPLIGSAPSYMAIWRRDKFNTAIRDLKRVLLAPNNRFETGQTFQNLNLNNSLAHVLSRKFTHPSNALINLSRMISQSSENIYYNDYPGTGKTYALIASCLNCVDVNIDSTQAIIICGSIDSAFYAYRKTMDLVEAMEPKITVRFVTDSVFNHRTSISPSHIVIGINRAVNALPQMHALKLVCVDDVETLISYVSLREFIRSTSSCTVFVSSSHTPALLVKMEEFGGLILFLICSFVRS